MANPEKLIDFGYRAVHETTAKAKSLVNAYYGNARAASPTSRAARPADGRALKAAQKFPDDFDGIVAGAPALNTTGRAIFAVYAAQALRKEEGSYIPSTEVSGHPPGRARGVRREGRREGRRAREPARLHWDPKAIECKAGTDDASCLTPAQVVAARALYQPVKNARTGKLIFSGLELGQRDGLEHVRQPAAVSDRHADVPADDLQEPGVGLQDVELRRRHGARGQHREGQHQRDGSQPPAVPRARRQADPVPRLGRPADPAGHAAPSITRPWSSGPAAPTR